LCKNFQRQIVATSFLYLTVHRRIAGDVHTYLKFAPKEGGSKREFFLHLALVLYRLCR